MAKNKEQLLEEAQALGIDTKALPQDGQDGPSNTTLEAAIAEATAEAPCHVDMFIAQGEAGINVPVAGLLAAFPELRDQELKPSAWRSCLDAYLQSERH